MRLYYDQTTGDALFTHDGSSESAPAGTHIEVAQDYPSLNGLKVVNGVPGYADLTEVRREAIAKVNNRAGQVRLMFITDEPGQDMLYLKKEMEAVAYLAETPEPADLSGYVLMSKEVGPTMTAPTAYQLAQIWLYMSDQWKIVAGEIEAARLGTVYAIEAATTDAEITVLVAAGLAGLDQIAAAL